MSLSILANCGFLLTDDGELHASSQVIHCIKVFSVQLWNKNRTIAITMPFERFGRIRRTWESQAHGSSEFQASSCFQIFHGETHLFVRSCSYLISQPTSQ